MRLIELDRRVTVLETNYSQAIVQVFQLNYMTVIEDASQAFVAATATTYGPNANWASFGSSTRYWTVVSVAILFSGP